MRRRHGGFKGSDASESFLSLQSLQSRTLVSVPVDIADAAVPQVKQPHSETLARRFTSTKITPTYVSRARGAKQLGISPAKWDALVTRGKLPRPLRRLGRPHRWSWKEVLRFYGGQASHRTR